MSAKAIGAKTNRVSPGSAALNVDLLPGLIDICILHQACDGPISVTGMTEELKRRGYVLRSEVVSAMLDRLETKKYLRSQEAKPGKTVRRVYRATLRGKRAFPKAAEQLKDLWKSLSKLEGI